MAYKKLLQKIMYEKNLTATEIIKKCKEEYDIEISEGYFSKVKNKRKNPPSEKVSRAIAKVCGIDERILVIEGYIEKAPKEIKRAFENISVIAKLTSTEIVKLIDKNYIDEFEEYLRQEPLCNIIIDILDNNEKQIESLKKEIYIEKLDNGKEIKLGLANPSGIEVIDDAMSPKINKGDKITFEIIGENYKSTDILVVKTKKDPKVRLRNVININNTRKLQGYDEKYTEICDKQDLTILGKVNYVIKKI